MEAVLEDLMDKHSKLTMDDAKTKVRPPICLLSLKYFLTVTGPGPGIVYLGSISTTNFRAEPLSPSLGNPTDGRKGGRSIDRGIAARDQRA